MDTDGLARHKNVLSDLILHWKSSVHYHVGKLLRLMFFFIVIGYRTGTVLRSTGTIYFKKYLWVTFEYNTYVRIMTEPQKILSYFILTNYIRTYVVLGYVWVLSFLIVRYIFVQSLDMDQRATINIVWFYCENYIRCSWR